jgi:hypothetical protein
MLPTLVRAGCRTLNRGRRNPQKGDERLFHARPGRRRDAGLVRCVSSVTIGRVRPSPPPQRHPEHCSAIPYVVGVRGDKTPPRRLAVRLTAPRQLHPRVSVRTITKREVPTPLPSKPLLDGYMAHHDASPEARFTGMAVYSTTCAIPLHVFSTARHACKLPPLGL